MTASRTRTVKYAFKQSLPVMAGYLVLGIGFGILLNSKGYGAGWAFLMSAFIFAGSMQFVTIDLIGAGAGLLTAALMTVMVNARHIFYGISMLERYRDTGKRKPYLIFALTDETYSLVCSGEVPDGVDRNGYFFLVTLFDHCYWVIGGVLGALLGQIFPFDTKGIDFAMMALFLVVVVDQWRSTKNHGAALIGFGASLVSLLLFGPDRFLIPAMAAITVLLLLFRKQLAAEPEKEEVRDE